MENGKVNEITVENVRSLANAKGFDFMYIGRFYRADGTNYKYYRVFKKETQEVFSGSLEIVYEWLID